MKVKLISYTQDALELLLLTKNTRLANDGLLTLDDIKGWSHDKKMQHIGYMRDTIQSSWEFVDYVFQISEVTRAFTHQLVRTRTASFAQQSQRTVDVSNAKWETPIKVEARDAEIFDRGVTQALFAYRKMVANGASVQDARGVLPTNIHTSIITKMNLRTLSDLAEHRLCTRTQGEYQDVAREMIRLVHKVHHWTKEFEFLEVYCVKHGICAFPRYDGCPFKCFTVSREELDLIKKGIKIAFNHRRHVAVPKLTKEDTTC